MEADSQESPIGKDSLTEFHRHLCVLFSDILKYPEVALNVYIHLNITDKIVKYLLSSPTISSYKFRFLVWVI